MEDKRYIFETTAESITITNTECGMKQTLDKAELSPQTIEFFDVLGALLKQDLITAKQTKRRA